MRTGGTFDAMQAFSESVEADLAMAEWCSKIDGARAAVRDPHNMDYPPKRWPESLRIEV